MTVPIAIGLGIVVLGTLLVGVLLFGHHRPAAPTAAGASTTTWSTQGVHISIGRRAGSALVLLGLTFGLAGLLAAAVGAVVFLGGLAMGS